MSIIGWFKTLIYFYHGAAWVLCEDVLQDPSPTWELGLFGSDIMDLVATTGLLTFQLDNTSCNSAGKSGYYSPGHADCPAWFTDGLPVKVVCERQDTFVSATRFLGHLAEAYPTTGVYDEAVVEVECHDWMEYVSIQKIGQQAIQADKRADQALTTALTEFPIQPEDTDFDEGKETFDSIFDTDDAVRMSMARLFQKLCRNEGGGQIYLKGDGTLIFANRHARPATSADAFTLDATGDTPMNELDVSWKRKDIKNRVEAKMWPAEMDAAATTIVWELQVPFSLSAGQELILVCPFIDPDTGRRISAADVVDPLVGGTHIKFGSVGDGSSNNMISDLTFPMTVGGNTAEITLTNTGSSPGYVNFIEILGKGIYTYDALVLADENAASIAAKGERILDVKLEQITNPNLARTFAISLRQQLFEPTQKIESVRFLANFSDAFATAALTAEVNSRFALVEELAGVDASFFVNRLKFEQVGQNLWVEIVPAPAAIQNYFIWNVAGHGWDEGRWAF